MGEWIENMLEDDITVTTTDSKKFSLSDQYSEEVSPGATIF